MEAVTRSHERADVLLESKSMMYPMRLGRRIIMSFRINHKLMIVPRTPGD
jgi:hypothetical protein